MATLLGFDVGARRIGVAVAEEETGIAHRLRILAVNHGLEAAVMALIKLWRPQRLVVGRVVLEGVGLERSHAWQLATSFARRLEQWSQLPVVFADEAFSSREANAKLRGSGQRHDDDQAAAEILLTYLAETEKPLEKR